MYLIEYRTLNIKKKNQKSQQMRRVIQPLPRLARSTVHSIDRTRTSRLSIEKAATRDRADTIFTRLRHVAVGVCLHARV